MKTIAVSDKTCEWLKHRAGPKKTIPQVLVEIISAIESYEKDLAKYQAWVNASQGRLKYDGHDIPSYEDRV